LKGVDFKRNIRKSKSKVLQKYYNYEHTIEEDLVNVLNDLKISKNDKILDIGCGKGYALYLMHQFNFKNIDGIELSKKLSDIAKKNFIIIKKKTNIYNINATKFKYYENYIDDHVKMLNENNLKTCAWIDCKNLVSIENPHNTLEYY
jgi:tRNA1(Val) A37 N6-methylase TrmN6